MIPIPALLDVGSKLLDRFMPDPAKAAEAKAELEKMTQDGRIAEMNVDLQAYQTEQNNLTERLKADMGSDSWLSKNIRPLTLVFILLAYTTFGLMSAFDIDTKQAYVELLGQWGMLIMSFYFGGRTLEKIIDMKGKK
jgi:Holin of 3TMs, for gene-transfer release